MTEENALNDLPKEVTGRNEDDVVLMQLQKALFSLRNTKPEGRSDKGRHYAVAITDMEKVVAYFEKYVCS